MLNIYLIKKTHNDLSFMLIEMFESSIQETVQWYLCNQDCSRIMQYDANKGVA